MIKYMKRILILLALLIPTALSAQDAASAGFGLDPSDAKAVADMRARMAKIRQHRPTVALVLSGGGAKGAATVGALKYLEQYKFPVDMVLGTSIGGLIGGVYAMGYSPDFLDSLMRNIDWGITMSDRVDWEYIPYGRRKYKEKIILSIPWMYNVEDYKNQLKEDIRYANAGDGKIDLAADDNNEDGVIVKSLTSSLPSGVVFGQNVQYLISSLTPRYADSTDFLRNLPIPFVCVATDIVSGRAKVWHSGSMNTALRSTMSIPAVFTPVRTHGMVLVDGGMRNNFPVDLARQMGADVVIGIDLSDSKSGYEDIHNIADILWRGIDMFAEDSFERNIKKVDIRIHPDLTGYGMMDFNREAIDTMILRGYKGAEEMAPELEAVRRWLGTDTLVRVKPNAIDIQKTAVLIDSVEILGVSGKEADYVRTKLKVHAGDRVSRAEVEDALNTIFGKGSYEYVSYDMLGEDEPFRLRINFKRGPMNRLGIGFRVDTEDLVSLLLNVGLNTNSIRGSSLDINARVGANPYLDLHYAFETPKFPTLNARVDLRWTDHNNFLMGDNRFNVAYLSTTQELYLSKMGWSNLDIKGGVENTFFTIRRLLASDVEGDYDRSLWKMDYPGAFLDMTAYTLDDGYFPHTGFASHLRFDLYGRFFDGPGNQKLFGVLAASAQKPIPIGKKLTLSLMAASRFIVGQNIPIPWANIIGGEMVGRYADQHLPFIGLNNAAFRRNNIILFRNDFRWEFTRNNYLTAMFNYNRDFSSFKDFTGGTDIFGCGLGYAYDTVVGPIKAIVHWSTLSKKVGFYAGIGFDF